MYAVFQTGGKQYRIVEGQEVCIERLGSNVGEQVEFRQILVFKSDNFLKIGNPFIKNGTVIAKIVTHSLLKKVEIVKFNRRKHFRKHQGHRQYFTKIKIIKISTDII